MPRPLVIGWATAVFLAAACGPGSNPPMESGQPVDTCEDEEESGSWSQLSAGYSHSCAVDKTGSISCWGFDGFLQATPPEGSFESVHAGMHHTCARNAEGHVSCWGFDAYGQAQAPSEVFQSVSAGGYQSCGVTEQGTVSCWGGIRDGEADPPPGQFLSVSGGEGHTCGITETQEISCWGFDMFGQASPPAGSFLSVSAGWTHTCGIREDLSLACWGQDLNGEVSPPEGEFQSVSAGKYYSCGIHTSGALECWGLDDLGLSLPPEGEYQSLSAGGDHACALRTDGEYVCWGQTSEPETPVDSGAGFAVGGIVWDIGDFDWGAEGLCVHIAEVDAFFTGGEPRILGSSTVSTGGAFEIRDVQTSQAVGLLLLVDDCGGVEPLIPTATGIPPAHFVDLEAGEYLGGLQVPAVDEAMATLMNQGLAFAGETDPDVAASGGMLGYVRQSNGVPIAGAEVECESLGSPCDSIYYGDNDVSDGLFTQADALNSATSGDCEVDFFIPEASLANYSATAAGHSFDSILFGGAPGYITVLAFVPRN